MAVREAIEFSRQQFHVLTTAEAAKFGISRWSLQRLVKTGHWQRLFYGIYLTHSAQPTWVSRAFAALAIGGPASFLSHETAWFLHGLQDRPPGKITLGVPSGKHLTPRPGLRITQRSNTPEVTGKLTRTTPEETLLDLIPLQRNNLDIIGLLTHAFRNGVHPNKTIELLDTRQRLRNRGLLRSILTTITEGTESPLEHLYDQNVEILHGLPRSEKQSVDRVAGQRIRVDRRFRLFQLLIELDGQLGHPGGRTDRDTWRDNANLLKNGATTLRYRWANIVGTPCETAGQIAAALAINGWRGEPIPCSAHCRVRAYEL